ncbi:kinesin-like protein Klp8 [Nowakowskiella sp. JEL0078]|nr:kinesin-like protein Klp8 [Nowakowskiella sp. JEL0078]
MVVSPISSSSIRNRDFESESSEDEDYEEISEEMDDLSKQEEQPEIKKLKNRIRDLNLGSELLFELLILEISGISESDFTQIHAQFRMSQFGTDQQSSAQSEADFSKKNSNKFSYSQMLCIPDFVENVIPINDRVFATEPISDFDCGPIKVGFCQIVRLLVTENVRNIVSSGAMRIEVFGRLKKTVSEMIENEFHFERRNLGLDSNSPLLPNAPPRQTQTKNPILDSFATSAQITQSPNSSHTDIFTLSKGNQRHDVLAQVKMLEYSQTSEVYKHVPVQTYLFPTGKFQGNFGSSSNTTPSGEHAVPFCIFETGTFLAREGLQRKFVLRLTHTSSLQFPWKRVVSLKIGNIRRVERTMKIDLSTNQVDKNIFFGHSDIDTMLVGLKSLHELPAAATRSLGDGRMNSVPIPPDQRVKFLPDGRSILEIEFPWDSEIHGDCLNRATKGPSRIDMTVVWDLEIDSQQSSFGEALPPREVEMPYFSIDFSIIIFERDFKVKSLIRSGFMGFLNGAGMLPFFGPGAKYAHWVSNIFSVSIQQLPMRPRKFRSIWKNIDSRYQYVRGEEALLGWVPAGQELVLKYWKGLQKLRWRERVELTRQRIEEEELESNNRMLFASQQTKITNASPVVLITQPNNDKEVINLPEEISHREERSQSMPETQNPKGNLLIAQKIIEIWKRPVIRDFGLEKMLNSSPSVSNSNDVFLQNRAFKEQNFRWTSSAKLVPSM